MAFGGMARIKNVGYVENLLLNQNAKFRRYIKSKESSTKWGHPVGQSCQI